MYKRNNKTFNERKNHEKGNNNFYLSDGLDCKPCVANRDG